MGLSSIPALFRRVFYGKDNEDAKLVQKIDLLIMTYACLTQFINILGKYSLHIGLGKQL